RTTNPPSPSLGPGCRLRIAVPLRRAVDRIVPAGAEAILVGRERLAAHADRAVGRALLERHVVGRARRQHGCGRLPDFFGLARVVARSAREIAARRRALAVLGTELEHAAVRGRAKDDLRARHLAIDLPRTAGRGAAARAPARAAARRSATAAA